MDVIKMFIKKRFLKFMLENDCCNKSCSDCSMNHANSCVLANQVFNLIDKLFNKK